MKMFTLKKLGMLLLPLLMLAGLVLPANASPIAAEAAHQVEFKPVEPKQIDSNLYFEPNVGQMDAQVKFLGAGEGYRLYLMENELRLAMFSENESSAIGIGFPGSNPDPNIMPALPLDGKSHFYRGNDPAFWVENVAHYGEVTYSELYPGIDLVFHRRNGSPEYDFVVSPGVDPDVIRLAIEGADTMEIDSAGRLALGFSNGRSIVMQAPVVYQDSKAQRVDGHFRILPDNTVAFALGQYDRSKTLVIDPELVFSTYLGGEGDDTYSEGRGADGTGNYTCMHSDANSIPGYGVVRDPSTFEDVDVVCVKHDPSGQIVYATVIGGQAGEGGPEDECLGCEITLDYISDEQGNVHVTGFTSSPDFPTLHAFQTSLFGEGDAFILTLDPTGALAFSSYMGGDDGEGHIDGDQGNAISTTSDGSLLIGGTTASPDFLESTGIPVNHLTAPVGFFDNFAMKLNPDRSIAFVSVWGGEAYEEITTIVTDSDGSIFTTGVTESSDYPVSAGAYQGQLKGDSDGFLTKLSPMGAEIVYSSYIGGSAEDVPLGGGVVDAKGDYIFTGITWSADFPVTEDAFQDTFGGESDAIIVVFNPDGNGADDLVYSSFLGGPGYDDAINSVVDRFGNIYLIGEANESGFPVTADAFQSDPGGNADAFLAVLNLSLPPSEQLLYGTRIGGANSNSSQGDDPDAGGLDFASGLGQDGLGNVYMHGLTESNDFPVSDGDTIGGFAAVQTEINGNVDNFVAKFHIWDEVEINIKPRDTRNIVLVGKSGVVPLAILSSSKWDAPAEVDPTSVRLAGAAVVVLNGAGESPCRSKDVNRDGLDDLSCFVQANQLSLHTGKTVATLIARTHDGDILMGQDVVRFVPQDMGFGGFQALQLH